MAKFFKAFIITLLLIVILFVGSIGYFLIKNHVENPKDFLKEFSESENRLTFLLLGVDSLDAKSAENTRSDTIMIVNMDFQTGDTNIISVPRDTYAEIKGYKKQKINHSYNYGGSELTLQTVNNLLGTDIKYYMTIDYRFVKDVVNTIGGVEVDVPVDMYYKDEWADPPLEIDLKAGLQTLNGDKAIQFLRFRKYSEADLARVSAQQQFVSAFLQKLKEPSSLLKAPLMMNSYDKYTISNIPFSMIVKAGINVRKVSSDKISVTTLPGVAKYKNKISYFFLNEEEADTLLKGLNLK
ncbi:LCP family protein [Peptoniphilus catoniae]|uniref:LCP family protein n=1 Tax=Peptoniphilus catoniae TaxID=1660341 RepID=UPI0010FD8189|nr:LCP family protein [Peptoniphilus catoniae]